MSDPFPNNKKKFFLIAVATRYATASLPVLSTSIDKASYKID